ncbi:uncharacterized protein LOC135842580 [Planococcus citri]|uniref:uncharacterized protein LOC135842580 n=1 Tax=Planococcus citri TaxID=170843 RepID=UPI0031F96EDB
MKILLLSILNSVLFIHQSIDAQNQFDPLLLEHANSSSIDWYKYDLPRNIPSVNDKNTISVCPIETEEEKMNLEIISQSYSQAKYCLYEKNFNQYEPKLCTEQPKPWLKFVEENEHQCGTLEKYKSYDIGFYFCGKSTSLTGLRGVQNDHLKIKWFENILKRRKQCETTVPFFFDIYRLCIDVSNAKAWKTIHEIQTPVMFTEDEEKLQLETGNDLEIGTDAILFEENTFVNLKQKYDEQDEASEKMIPTFMVPKEHVALRAWRYTVNHFINVAPLWYKLEKLMTAINQGLKKIALKLHTNTSPVRIYTTVIDSIEEEATRDIKNNPAQFSNNVWYKFIIESRTQTAAFVVLHNTPNSPPVKKICLKEMPCNLKNWYEKDHNDDEDISNEIFEYAYCCHPSQPQVRKLFEEVEEYLIDGPLNLDAFF